MSPSYETLWKLDPHTAAKHAVLRSYLEAWIGIMGHAVLKYDAQPRVLLVDGFAGPGRYVDGEPGSPLIMLDVILKHSHFERFSDVTFFLYFIEQDEARVEHLRRELEKIELPPNVRVEVEAGAFEDKFDELVTVGEGMTLIPTFAFIDPFGYTQANMSLTGRLLDFRRTEALFFLPLTHISRFLGKEDQAAGLDALFGSPRWRDAIPLKGRERNDFLVRLFEDQLSAQGQVEHVRSFEIRTKKGGDNRLVFATGHPKGLDAMKDAMWAVDPQEGRRFVAQMPSGQEVLFAPDDEVNTDPLLNQLRVEFGDGWFTVEQAQIVTLRSPFKSTHLKKRTLKRAEQDLEVLEVKRSSGQRKGTFVAGTKMRFCR